MIGNILKIILTFIALYLSFIAKDKKIKIYWSIVSAYWLTNFLSTLQK